MDIKDNIYEVLAEVCPQCPLDVTMLDSEEFACIDGSPKKVLYRAEMSANPESDCTVLLTQIRQWVRSGTASVSVLGNRLDVDQDCRVEIEDLISPPDCTVPNTPGKEYIL